MCQTTISNFDDMDEISTTSRKKTGRHIEPRKIRKPLMEKKRRARINQSLDELKRIVVDAEKLAGQDLSRLNKLEKADILEMTVRYLKRKATPPPVSSNGPDVYLAGYRQCIGQVQELLAEQWSDERRQQSGRRMVEHLEACVQRLAIPPKRRLSSGSSSSDESIRPPLETTALYHHHMTDRRHTDPARNVASSDDDSVQESDEQLVTAISTTDPKPSSDHTTKFHDVPSKSMWRPW